MQTNHIYVEQGHHNMKHLLGCIREESIVKIKILKSLSRSQIVIRSDTPQGGKSCKNCLYMCHHNAAQHSDIPERMFWKVVVPFA
eukprot:11096245-Ditylum_brightwellii.AAC.1